MDTTIITLIEIIKGSFSVRILGNKLNVKNDKIRLINICIDNKSRVAIVQRFFFLSFFFLFDLFPRISLILRFKIHRFVRNSRDFGISVLFIFVGGWDVIRIDQEKDIGNTIKQGILFIVNFSSLRMSGIFIGYPSRMERLESNAALYISSCTRAGTGTKKRRHGGIALI